MTSTNNTANPSPLAKVIIDYLACPCRYFPPQPDDTEVLAAWQEAKARGAGAGFTPVLVVVSKTLLEALVMNACDGEDPEDSDWAFDREQVENYRREALAEDTGDGGRVLETYRSYYLSHSPEFRAWMEAPAPAELPASEPVSAFWSHRNYTTGGTRELILAEIPTASPWEVFAWLPFGGWNECPDTPALMTISRRWHEGYGAVPAVVGKDTLEFALPAPVDGKAAWTLAKEQVIFCPDSLDTEGENPVAKLAGELAAATVWSFWWD